MDTSAAASGWVPPHHIMGGVATTRLAFLRDPSRTGFLSWFTAYPQGFSFVLVVEEGWRRTPADVDQRRRRAVRDSKPARERLAEAQARRSLEGNADICFTFTAAGGELIHSQHAQLRDGSASSGATGRSWKAEYWVPIVPSSGAVEVHIRWPSLEIDYVGSVEGDEIRRAAAAAIDLSIPLS